MEVAAKFVRSGVVSAQIAAAVPNARMSTLLILLPYAISAPFILGAVRAAHLQVFATLALLASTSKGEGAFLACQACQAALTAPIVLIVASVNQDFTSARQTNALPAVLIRQDAPFAHLGVSVLAVSGDSSSTIIIPALSVKIPTVFSVTKLSVWSAHQDHIFPMAPAPFALLFNLLACFVTQQAASTASQVFSSARELAKSALTTPARYAIVLSLISVFTATPNTSSAEESAHPVVLLYLTAFSAYRIVFAQNAKKVPICWLVVPAVVFAVSPCLTAGSAQLFQSVLYATTDICS